MIGTGRQKVVLLRLGVRVVLVSDKVVVAHGVDRAAAVAGPDFGVL